MDLSRTKRAYHFINMKYGVDAIRGKKIKISTLLGLNDPFELLAHNVQDRTVRTFLGLAKEQFASEFGIICFSKESTSPVQWAHYADRHQGLCLGFDVAEELLNEVRYVDQHYDEFKLPDKEGEEEWAGQVLGTKFKQWAYEQEVRVFAELKEQIKGLFFREFDTQMVLREVQVGFNCPITRAELSKSLKAHSEVKVFKVRPSFGTFEMIENNNPSLWK